jgi:hypothetical protein
MAIEGEEIQTKSTDNLLNIIITESFPNLEKEKLIQVHGAFQTLNEARSEKKHSQKYN